MDDALAAGGPGPEAGVLGRAVRQPIPHVETFPSPPACRLVRFRTEELTSVCPVTGQPDLATVVIEYAAGSGPKNRNASGGACRVETCLSGARTAVLRCHRTLRITPSSIIGTRCFGVPSKSNGLGRFDESRASSAIETFGSNAWSPIRPQK